MHNRIFALAVSAALIVTLNACKTVADPKPASDTDRSRNSWCQGDTLIRYSQADRPAQDDPGNQLDTDKTVAALQEHNARLRAACPEG